MAGMDDELLARYLAGQADAAERDQVRAWAGSGAAREQELRLLEQAWKARPAPGVWDVDRAWHRVAGRLDQAGQRSAPSWRRWMPALAAAAVLLAGAVYVTLPDRSGSSYATAVGEQRNVELADGSRVVLAPASRLEVSRSYGSRAREVTLEGRAWFEVEHDAARPFRVVTGDVVIEDLGTAFEVLAPGGGAMVQVSVVEGAVAVRHVGAPAHETVRLGPGDLARVDRGSPPAVRHDAPVQKLVGWRDGRLEFDDATLAEVAAELGRWYGVRFVIPDAGLRRRTLSSTFPTADLGESLAILRLALGLAVEQRGDTLVLEAGPPR